MTHKSTNLLLASLMLLTAAPSLAETNWPSWRGPQGSGAADGSGYPVKWSTEENVVWKYELPGVGASTPAIWQDKIFVTGENGGMNNVLCLNRDGKKQWEVKLDAARPAKNRGASGSNPSPTTDGKYVFVYYKSGMFACLDMAGEVVWKKNLQQSYGEDTLWWDLGTSPVLTKDLVVVACMQSGDSYLVGFEKGTGKVAWKHDRNLDAPGESAQSYTTPVVVSRGDKEVILVLGADHATAHDAKTGEQLWVAGGLNPGRAGNWRSISSPVVAGDLLFAPYGRGQSLTAIRLGGAGDVTKSHVVWQDGPSADVPTPAAADGQVYVCTDRGEVIVMDAESGKHLSETALPRGRSKFWSSPILADGRLYATNQDGTTYVLKLGPKLELLAENKLDEYTVATPVFVDGRIYLRTDGHLYCIGEE
ncbi:MAG: PQQ-binding-like beta-propeller repeat protein [Pirellulaceae bacterium]